MAAGLLSSKARGQGDTAIKFTLSHYDTVYPNSYKNYYAGVHNAEIYEWKVSPASRASVDTTGRDHAQLLFNNAPEQTAALRLKIRKNGEEYFAFTQIYIRADSERAPSPLAAANPAIACNAEGTGYNVTLKNICTCCADCQRLWAFRFLSQTPSCAALARGYTHTSPTDLNPRLKIIFAPALSPQKNLPKNLHNPKPFIPYPLNFFYILHKSVGLVYG
jgi:hypothetical protein